MKIRKRLCVASLANQKNCNWCEKYVRIDIIFAQNQKMLNAHIHCHHLRDVNNLIHWLSWER